MRLALGGERAAQHGWGGMGGQPPPSRRRHPTFTPMLNAGAAGGLSFVQAWRLPTPLTRLKQRMHMLMAATPGGRQTRVAAPTRGQTGWAMPPGTPSRLPPGGPATREGHRGPATQVREGGPATWAVRHGPVRLALPPLPRGPRGPRRVAPLVLP